MNPSNEQREQTQPTEGATWEQYAVSFLPDAPLDEQTTEFAFIEGAPFVNARKHEQVCARHAAENERLRQALRDRDSDIVQEQLGDDARAEHERLREALEALRCYLGKPHHKLGEACGVDACVLCLAEGTVTEALGGQQ